MVARIVLTILLVAVGARAEATALRGLILANELGGPPVANVQVSAAGANSSVSMNDGTFSLTFPSKQPGDMVRLTIFKKGQVVVNDFELHLALRKDADSEPVVILICKEESREEMARRYYRLKSYEGIEEAYKQRVKELESHQQLDKAALARLKEERDQARLAADKAAEQLARLKPEETSEFYQQAMQLFLDGKIGEAINVLETEKLRHLLDAAKRKKAEAEKAETEAIQAYLLRARLLTIELRFAEAERTYKEALLAAPDSFDINFGFAVFNQELKRYKQALPAYERCLELVRHNGSRADAAMTLNNLGVLYGDQNRMVEAQKAYEEALKTYRELAQSNPEAYLPDVATTLNNLGVLYGDQNRMVEAQKAYEEALKTYRELAQSNPEAYLPYVATTLNNLGVLYRVQNRMVEAQKAYEEALLIYEDCARRNSERYYRDVERVKRLLKASKTNP